MKFGNEFWLILLREYISPNLFAVGDGRMSPSGESVTCSSWLGMISGDPVASSVDDAAESSFGASRTPNSTQGTVDESAWPGLHNVHVWHLDLLVHALYHPIAFRMVGKCSCPAACRYWSTLLM